jgi:plasmid stabilization system protein ParE
MIYDVRISTDAQNDILQISQYLLVKFGTNVQKKQITLLIKQIRSLTDYPNRGVTIPFKSFQGTCLLREKHNTIFYRIIPNTHEVVIMRVLDNRENIAEKLHNYFEL